MEILVPCCGRSPVHCPTVRQSSRCYAYYASLIAFSLVWAAEIRESYFSCLLCISSWKSLSPSIGEEDKLLNMGTRAAWAKVGRRNTVLFPWRFFWLRFSLQQFSSHAPELVRFVKSTTWISSKRAFQRPPPIVLLQLWVRAWAHNQASLLRVSFSYFFFFFLTNLIQVLQFLMWVFLPERIK